MLEAGVHFGHPKQRLHAKMLKYIFSIRNGIHIIDLQQTVHLYREAHDFVVRTVSEGGHVLFVGTKAQAQEVIKEEALYAQQPYVDVRWLGGTLTNYATIQKTIDRLRTLEKMFEEQRFEGYNKKEILYFEREMKKLEATVGGIKDMKGLPSIVFIIDPHKEHIAVKECVKLGIPTVAITDTNCNPDNITYVIPGNDDAIRSIKLFAHGIATACLEGMALRQTGSTNIETLFATDTTTTYAVADDSGMIVVDDKEPSNTEAAQQESVE